MQEFQPNDTINNRYRVVRKLGAGAMGSVYLCEDSVENNVKVALKVLISEDLGDQDIWAKGEYEALTRLRHPNLARVYNFGRIRDSKEYFIVSEFIKGIDLYSATEYLNYEELTDILVQICRALEYIHSQGYVHFDIKPDNILVTRYKTVGIKEGSKVQYEAARSSKRGQSVFAKPNVKLIDFGLAEKITGSFSFAIKGTLNYLAPEILNGQTPDKRADLYSLGVTLYQVANRDLPFYKEFGGLDRPGTSTKRSDLFEIHMKRHPDFLRTLILKLLEEDSAKRFQNAREVIQFINKNSTYQFELETAETRASYFFSAKLVGRKREMNLLKSYQERFFHAEGGHAARRAESEARAAAVLEQVPAAAAGEPDDDVEEESLGPGIAPVTAPVAGEGAGIEEEHQGAVAGVGEAGALQGNAAPPAVEGAAATVTTEMKEAGAAAVPGVAQEPAAPVAPAPAAGAAVSAAASLAAPAAPGHAPEGPDADETVAGTDFPALILVSGEMGSGKSRLLEEFQHLLRLNDTLVFAGSCYEGNNKSYQPLIEILRQIVYRFGLDSEFYKQYRAEILRLVPELRAKGDGEEAPRDPGGRADKERIHFIDSLVQLLIEAARATPYVLVVNNLHWIDEASIDILEGLLERVTAFRAGGETVRLMVCASLRPEEPVGARLSGLLEGLKEKGQCQEVQVRRLKQTQVREFLCSMLNFSDVPEDFVAKLHEATGGNPLLIVETLKALEDEGVIKNVGESWVIKATSSERIAIPRSMEGLLGRRLEKIEPLKRQLLDALSVISKPVSPKFLQTLARFEKTPILADLRDLERMGIVAKLFEDGKLHFQVAQSKVTEILYAKIAEGERRAYHAEVAEALGQVYRGREEEILEDLTYHYQRSDRTDKAIEVTLRTGDWLRSIFANERAYECYLYVLQQVEERPEKFSLWLDTREKLGDLCTAMGRYDMAERSYGRLLEEDARQTLGRERVVKIYLSRGRVFEIQGDYDSALKCYKDARNFLSGFDKDSLLVERLHVFNCIGWVYVCMGKYEKAMAISLEALRVIEGKNESIEHAMVYNTIGSANYYKGNVGTAVEYHRRSLQIRENLERIPEITASLNSLGAAHLAGCEYGEAAEQVRRALKISEETGDPYGRAMSLHSYARLYFAVGLMEQGWQALEESMRLSKSYNMRYLSVQNYIVRGQALREQGDYAKAEGNLFRALTAFSKQGNRWGLCTVLLELAGVHRLGGNTQEALNSLNEARSYAEALDIQSLRVSCLLEEACILRGAGDGEELERSAKLLERAAQLAERCASPELIGEVAHEIGETLVRQRRLREATQQYTLAEGKFREVLENLPEEFREAYRTRLARRFQNWKGSVARKAEGRKKGSTVRFRTEASKPAGKPGAPAAASTAEESLKRVGTLIARLRSEESLKSFLCALLDEILAVGRGDLACWLLVSGEDVSMEASRSSSRAEFGKVEDLLRLELLEKVLAEKRPIFLANVADDPSVFDLLGPQADIISSLAVLPLELEPRLDGVLYLINPSLPPGTGAPGHRGDESAWMLQPFLSLIPVAYSQFGREKTGA